MLKIVFWKIILIMLMLVIICYINILKNKLRKIIDDICNK